jgi:formylglycine-generating enzyme required for sulfatase activity/O-acetyl-ADP-ribose deacetylase (regulator of RNase III)
MDPVLRQLHRALNAAPGDASLQDRYQGHLARLHPGNALGLLRSREAWQRADPILQDAAILLVSRKLPSGWTWLETRRYSCGGQTHRIAAFKFEPLEIRFHLIPGGHTLRGTADPVAEAAYWKEREVEGEEAQRLTGRTFADESPVHELIIPPLLVAQAPLSREEYARFPRPTYPVPEQYFYERTPGPRRPVHGSDPSIFDAPIAQMGGEAVRLLSESEWEFACRAGTTTRYYWGDTFDERFCWHEGNSDGEPHPSAPHQERANAFGLIDMLGNVHELCRDTYNDNTYRDSAEILREEGYPDAPSDHRAVVVEGQRGRILRGGSGWSRPFECRSASRYRLHGSVILSVGGRLSRSLPTLVELSLASPPTRTFGGLRVDLVYGDLAFATADAIANAANDQLVMGGGVAAALRAEGGETIQSEAVQSAPTPLGDVVRTGAGDLLARFVYHAVVIRYDLKGGTRKADVRVAVRNLLAFAAEDNASTLALPLFGAGVGGLAVGESLETILDALEEHAESAPTLRVEVRVVDEAEFLAACESWQRYQTRTRRDAQVGRAAEDYMQRLLEERAREPEDFSDLEWEG